MHIPCAARTYDESRLWRMSTDLASAAQVLIGINFPLAV
jgi:hypothetical protein